MVIQGSAAEEAPRNEDSRYQDSRSRHDSFEARSASLAQSRLGQNPPNEAPCVPSSSSKSSSEVKKSRNQDLSPGRREASPPLARRLEGSIEAPLS